MSTDLKVTSLGEASSAQPNYRAWLLKVEDGSGAEFTMEVRIYCTAKPALEGELGRPLAQEEMEMIAACLAKEKAMSAFSIHLIPARDTIDLTRSSRDRGTTTIKTMWAHIRVELVRSDSKNAPGRQRPRSAQL